MTITGGLRRLVRLIARPASAHCDTEDGPVVTAGRRALESGDVNHALAWVHPEAEGEVRAAFAAAVATGDAQRAAAERRFLETLVRAHRTGEGATFEGIKPAGTPQPPAVSAADRAVAERSLAPLAGLVDDERWPQLQDRFADVLARADHDVDDLPAARGWVEAYVRFVHHAAGHEQAAAGH